ncbi:hypothetical protein KDL29_00510 [bacterium]|nr:hypothetical protein [bacterium]
MPERFTDNLLVSLRAGKGGDGAVHFDSRKYEAFGGPDGGDGGHGGSIYLVGDKNIDNLQALEYMDLSASDGANGAGGLKKGRDADDFEIRVPIGTLAYESRTGAEIGHVTNGDARLLVAQGGKGGKGNPKYATGSRRTPRIAQDGEEGEQLGVSLRWRIYAETMLVEPHETVMEEDLLLPRIIGKDHVEIEFELFRRKPRWLRIKGLYEMYDVAYLPVVLFDDGEIEQEQLHHAYWARHLFVNLQPFGDDVEAAWEGLARHLQKVTYRQLEMLFVCATVDLPLDGLKFDVENAEQPALRMLKAASADEALEHFMGQLTGGVVN